MGLARLGFKVALYSIHGDDEIGKEIDEALEKEGVDPSMVVVQKDTPSRYSTIINFQSERTILEYYVPHKYRMPHDFPKTDWVYVSSVGKNYEEFFASLTTLVKEKRLKLAFNPTNVQLASPLESYLPLIQVCKIIFMNLEEAARMMNYELRIKNARSVKNLLSQVFDLGPGIVVITDGKNGSYAYDGEKYYHLEILDSPVVSVTGAGDAYACGFMGAIMKREKVAEAMRWGSANAAAVVGKFGPQTGLLSEESILNVLADNPGFKPKEI